MMSLFKSFDLFYFYFQFLTYFLILNVIILNFYKVNKMSKFYISIKNFLIKFFHSLKLNKFSKISLDMFISILFFIFFMNFFSVYSYNFPFTSQISVIFLISLSLWLTFILFSLFKNMKYFVSHCIPEGAPLSLSWFLFLIELVSNIIRPLTLAVRLFANILAGHLLLILLSLIVLKFFTFIPVYIILNSVEIFVALIQSYIFVTMVTLYFSEV